MNSAPRARPRIALIIDDVEIQCAEGATILEAADEGGVYIPRLCAHPELPAVDLTELTPWREVYWGSEAQRDHPTSETYDGCGLCVVSVEGRGGPVRACATRAEPRMRVTTHSADLQDRRRAVLRTLFATHPHACVQCAQRAGCALEPCSTNVAKEERCCAIFHHCELRRVAEFVGIPQDTPRYRPAGFPLVTDGPLFRWDPNLCIGCLRCVRICRDVRKVDALGFVRREDGTPLVGMRAPTLEASGCVFCLSCVEVCPTGTLQLKFEEPRVAGERAPRCVAGCPAGMDIPRYLRAIRRGDFAAADAVIREASPFPRVLGQVCFHPCEDHCLRGLLSQPVAICALKRAAIEHVDEDSRAPQPAPRPDTGKTVAIIGSGPAGLTAAWFLRLKGHGVTVFEAEAAAGGWMRDGIPNYRLSPTALEQDIRDILALGVDVRTGVAVGRDIHFETLRKDHDAVFVATGARKAKALPCTGADLLGVEQGLALLQHLATAGAEDSGVADQVVVVIGGGNVAIDVARSAQRLGAREVHLYCLEQRAAMPAYTWEIADAEREGVIVHPGWGPVRITGDGRVEQVEFNRCLSVFDESGRFAPQLDAATSHVQTADRVLVAIGQEPDADLLADLGGVTLTTSRYVEVRADSLRTSVDGVFAGGEVVSGPASVVAAVGHGRRAAATIDRYLGGDGDIHVKIADETLPDVAIAAPDGFAALERIPVPHSTSAAANWWDLAEGAYSPEAATREAERCLACDLRLRIQAVAAPRQAWLEFSEPTIAGVPEASGVYRLLDGNQEVYAVKGTANLRLALTEIAGTTKAKYFLFETDPMYSKRESELIQEYLQEHGRMPPGEGDDDLDDLF